MNSDSSNLRQQQEQQSEQSSELKSRQEGKTAREFQSLEEMIRFDAAEAQPPEAIAERLKKSIAAEPKPARSWWRRIFGKDSQ